MAAIRSPSIDRRDVHQNSRPMLVNQVRFESQTNSPEPSTERNQAVLFAAQVVAIQEPRHFKEVLIDSARVCGQFTVLLDSQPITFSHLFPP
jgi:hypothetical protein